MIYNISTGFSQLRPKKERAMRCLQCGADGVHHVNAEDVSNAGGCTIKCTECGQLHDGNVMFNTEVLNLPMPMWQKLCVWGIIALVAIISTGISLLF